MQTRIPVIPGNMEDKKVGITPFSGFRYRIRSPREVGRLPDTGIPAVGQWGMGYGWWYLPEYVQ